MKNNTLTDSYICEGQLSIFDILSAQQNLYTDKEDKNDKRRSNRGTTTE